jgi:hypothetical protein
MTLLHQLYPVGMLSGGYEAAGDPLASDIISVHEWGPCEPVPGTTSVDPGEINRQLATMALEMQVDRFRPIVGTYAISAALTQLLGQPAEVDYLVRDRSGTVGEIQMLLYAMEAEGYTMPALLANGRHIGRVAMHARHEGIANYVIPPNLPVGFRPESSQLGIRSLPLWIAHEALGIPLLHAKGDL